jgi:hypothetical protein
MPGAAAKGQASTALVSVAAATLLVVLKLGTGILTGSLGLISAGIESSGDVVAAVLTVFAIRLSGRPADADHPARTRRSVDSATTSSCGACGCVSPAGTTSPTRSSASHPVRPSSRAKARRMPSRPPYATPCPTPT